MADETKETPKDKGLAREDGGFPANHDPTKDKGPERPEDTMDVGAAKTPLSAEELPAE